MKFFLLSMVMFAATCSADFYNRASDRGCVDIDLAAKVGKCDRDQVAALAQLVPGTCKDAGFTVPHGTFDYAAGICGNLTFNIYTKEAVNGDFYYRASDKGCGDIELAEKVGECTREQVVEKGQLLKGTCKDAGYTVSHGTYVYDAGICGNLTINVYTKESAVNGDFYYRASDKGCGDIELDEKVGECTREQVVEKGQLLKGTCKDAGYTVSHGTYVYDAGICGNLTINVYTKEFDFFVEVTPRSVSNLMDGVVYVDEKRDLHW